MHVQAVGECNRRAFAQIVMDVFLIGFSLQFIGHGEHDQVAPSGGFCDPHNLEAFALGLLRRRGALAQGHNNILRPAVAQVQRVRMALAAIAQDGNFFVFD